MVDLILAHYLWHERDRELTLRAERERLMREGRQPAPSVGQTLRTLSGEALISLGYWLKSNDARSNSRAISLMPGWAAAATSSDMDGATPRTFIYYSQLMPAGAGRSSGLMLFSVTWLPVQTAPARS